MQGIGRGTWRGNWRSRQLWHAIGYGLSAAWIAWVIYMSGGDADDPWFDYIFIVPLGGWAVGITVAAVLKRVLPPPNAAAEDGPEAP
jgi:hypothetical protein